MRKSMLAGLILALTTVLVVLASGVFDLKLESVALLGAALGAVVVLVPDRTPLMGLAGFAGGVVAAWIGYILRAAVLPDSTGGRAVAAGLVVALCVAVVALSMERFSLWSTLLGAAGLAGAYELSFAAAPPEVLATSTSAATTLMLTVAVGFVVTLVAAPAVSATHRKNTTERSGADAEIREMENAR